MSRIPLIKVYNSYGNNGHILVIGHVFLVREKELELERMSRRSNLIELVNLFRKQTIPNAKLRMRLGDEVYDTSSEFDGFFKFDVHCKAHQSLGWNEVEVSLLDINDAAICSSKGALYIPNHSKYSFISDIDDTIMKSFSATIIKRLYELLSRSPVKRRLFDNTSKFYNALAESNVKEGQKNPFFYVSSSEWNLYDYLSTVFKEHMLPKGVFLLNTIKHLSSFLATGKNGHEGKLFRIARIIIAFPENRFVLLGDNSQKDPEIYAAIAEKYPKQISHILIRNVSDEKQTATRSFLKNAEHQGVHTCLFNTTQEAIQYCRTEGLIHDR